MQDIVVDRESDTPLYIQIRDQVRRAVAEERLKPGDRLPPVATFARQLGVTAATIRRAVEDLTADGLVESHVGRGTFIAAPCGPAAGQAPGPLRPARTSDPEVVGAARRLRMDLARSLEALMPLAQRPGLIRMTYGMPDPRLVPEGLLADLAGRALAGGQREMIEYGDRRGLPALRTRIAERLGAGPDQVLVTSGSQQAVSLLAQHALDRRLRVLTETPAYNGVPNAFGALGQWVEAVPRDVDGPLPDRMQRFDDGVPSVLYVCPWLHNPMGTDLAPDRRRMLLEWARRNGGLILADEVYRDLHPGDPADGSMTATVAEDRAVVVGSVSKSFICGLRVGWVVAAAPRIEALLGLKRAMDIACPPLMQAIALAAFEDGTYDAHLERARRHYDERREATLKALAAHMPAGVRWTTPAGGFQLWVELPEGYSAIALYLAALERGVAVVPGPFHDVDHRFMNAFRLCYGDLDPPQIAEGVELLADAVSRLLAAPPRDHGLSGLGDFV